VWFGRFGLTLGKKQIKSNQGSADIMRERFQDPEKSAHISLWRRIGLWLVAWGGAAIACAVPDPFVLLYAGAFPAGILAFLLPNGVWGNETTLGLLGLGWVFYAGLTVGGLREKRSSKYFRFYAVLCVLLALNVAGCRALSPSEWRN
jgi:hypothetical protein